MKLLKLSWRNIWRNKRRALITIASVFFAVFFCSVMDSYQRGTWEQMINNTLRTQAGHIEIQGTGYWDDKIIDNFMSMESPTISELRLTDNIDNVSPRVETFALAAFETVTKGIAVIGISPEDEAKKSNLASHIVEGRYLAETDNGIIVGEGLANYLKATVGDTLAFIGQGHFGASAAGLFPIHGIFRTTIGDLNNSVAYAALPAVQQFIDMPDGYSRILLTLKNDKLLEKSIEKVKQELASSGQYEVYSWHFTMQRLLQSAESDQAFSKIIIFILYLIVGFGILGTVIMLTNERQREFRTMISLGMSRKKLTLIVTIELLLMAAAGVLLGLAISYPIALYFHFNPIHISTGELSKMFVDYGMEPVMPTSIDISIFITQIVAVLLITALAAIYPIQKIKKIRLTEK